MASTGSEDNDFGIKISPETMKRFIEKVESGEYTLIDDSSNDDNNKPIVIPPVEEVFRRFAELKAKRWLQERSKN